VGPRACLEGCGEEKISCPQAGFEPQTIQPIAIPTVPSQPPAEKVIHKHFKEALLIIFILGKIG
jgi:hypothetical protein